MSLSYKDLTDREVSILSMALATARAKYEDSPPADAFEADRNRQLDEWIDGLEKWKQGA